MPFNHMSELQAAVYQLLSSDPKISFEIGDAIFDTAPPLQDMPESYIRIGEEEAKNRSSQTHFGVEAILRISVFSKSTNMRRVKELAELVDAAMKRENLSLTGAKLVSLHAQKSQAYRLEGGKLQMVRLWYKALLDTTYIIEA